MKKSENIRRTAIIMRTTILYMVLFVKHSIR